MTKRKNTISKWIYAARPHTLGASIAPMLILLAALIRSGNPGEWLLPYLLALIVALFAQISSNLANDYFDFRAEMDTPNRVGFERLISSGAVTPSGMLAALCVSALVTAASGVAFAYLEGWWILGVGAVVLLAMVGYSAGPFPLSHHGLGDLAVVLFYGLVPILVPCYALVGPPSLPLFCLALGIGIWETNILVCNNYRDYSEDLSAGKGTLVVRLGEKSGPRLYLLNALLSFAAFASGLLLMEIPPAGLYGWLFVLFAAMALMTLRVYRRKGAELNRMLGETNLLALLIGASLFVLILL